MSMILRRLHRLPRASLPRLPLSPLSPGRFAPVSPLVAARFATAAAEVTSEPSETPETPETPETSETSDAVDPRRARFESRLREAQEHLAEALEAKDFAQALEHLGNDYSSWFVPHYRQIRQLLSELGAANAAGLAEPTPVTVVDTLMSRGAVTDELFSSAILACVVSGKYEEALQIWVKYLSVVNSITRRNSRNNRNNRNGKTNQTTKESTDSSDSAPLVDLQSDSVPWHSLDDTVERVFVSAFAAYVLLCRAGGVELSAKAVKPLFVSSEFPRAARLRQELTRSGVAQQDVDYILDSVSQLQLSFDDPNAPHVAQQVALNVRANREPRVDALWAAVGAAADRSGRKLTERTIQEFLRAFLHFRRIDKVRSAWNSLAANGISPGIASWNLLLEAEASYGPKKERKTAVLLLLRMMQQRGVAPDATSYTQLLRCFFRAGEPARAAELLHTMESGQLGVAPTDVFYGEYILGVAQQSPQDAAEFWRQLRQQKPQFRPGLPAFNAILQAYGKTGQFGEAMQLLDEMPQLGVAPDKATYAVVLHLVAQQARSTGGQLDVAAIRALLEDAAKRGVKLNAVALNSVIEVLASGNDLPVAREVFAYMRESRDVRLLPTIHTYTSLMLAEARAGFLDNAALLLEEARDRGLTVAASTWNVLFQGCRDHGEVWRCVEFYDRMVNGGGAKPNLFTYFMVLDCMRQSSNYPFLERVLKDMDESGVVNFGNRTPGIVRGLAASGKVKVPERLLETFAENKQKF